MKRLALRSHIPLDSSVKTLSSESKVRACGSVAFSHEIIIVSVAESNVTHSELLMLCANAELVNMDINRRIQKERYNDFMYSRKYELLEITILYCGSVTLFNI